MISAILMLRRLAGALRVALREEDFARILGAGLTLIIIGSLAYSLGDVDATAGILEGAGFDDPRFEDVHEPVFYGHDVDAALAIVRGFQDTSRGLACLSEGEAARAVERLREMLAAHYSDERGVVLDSRSWLITAQRRG